MLDITAVRSHFPALATDWALFDNAGGSVPCLGVIERVADHMARRPVQLGATYDLSREASEAVDAGRRAMAELANVYPEEVVIGPSTTVLIQRLVEGMRPHLAPGDEVIVTNVDHEANVSPWHTLERDGVVIKEWAFQPETLTLEAADLDLILTDRTKVVAFAHVSNIIGAIHDVSAICRRVRDAGAISVVDGVACAPHRRPDPAFGADAYCFSAYKVFGPHQGVMIARRGLLEKFEPPYHEFLMGGVAGFEPAGLTYELAASLPGITDYLAALGVAGTDSDRIADGYARIEACEAALAAPLIEFLANDSRTTLLGPASVDPNERVPTISFTVEGRRSSEITPLLDERKLAVRFGHFYAYRPVRALGLLERDGVVRVSMLHYNAPEEVARLVAALDQVL